MENNKFISSIELLGFEDMLILNGESGYNYPTYGYKPRISKWFDTMYSNWYIRIEGDIIKSWSVKGELQVSMSEELVFDNKELALEFIKSQLRKAE